MCIPALPSKQCMQVLPRPADHWRMAFNALVRCTSAACWQAGLQHRPAVGAGAGGGELHAAGGGAPPGAAQPHPAQDCGRRAGARPCLQLACLSEVRTGAPQQQKFCVSMMRLLSLVLHKIVAVEQVGSPGRSLIASARHAGGQLGTTCLHRCCASSTSMWLLSRCSGYNCS